MGLNDISIVAYLTAKGRIFRKDYKGWWTNSPFSSDSEASFLVDHNNKWKCFSTGKGGRKSGAVSLAIQLDGSVQELKKIGSVFTPVVTPAREMTPFNGFIPHKYLDVTTEERNLIRSYAGSRKLIDTLEGVYFTKESDVWKRNLAVVFPHFENGRIVGAKFRNISAQGKDRFRIRGKLGFYTLVQEEGFETPIQYLVEGEANANSLYRYLKEIQKPGVVLSAGAVSAIPRSLPFPYPCKLIIDFDDSESTWLSRVSAYEHLGATAVKLIMKKGEDLNSLYCKGEMKLIDYVL